MPYLWAILAGALCAFFYRIGGMSKEEAKKKLPWLPSGVVNTKTRDLLCPAVCLGWMLAFFPTVQWYNHLIAFLLMFGAMTTYWDKLFKFDNYWFHGFMIGLAYLPYAIASGEYTGWAIRMFLLAILMGGWCAIFSDVDMEEYGRGAFIGLSLMTLMI